ncbi:MAG: hypothetical protein DSY42_04765 [Aquifex sp.]|nr:MAG: hypothetical protein DSY42_04765 [Aquifex sp.]
MATSAAQIQVSFFVRELAKAQLESIFFYREKSTAQINTLKFFARKRVPIYVSFEKRYESVPIEVYFRREGVKISVVKNGASRLSIRVLFFGNLSLPNTFTQYLSELGISVS